MGKILIIKEADFSQVAVDRVEFIIGLPIIDITSTGNVTISCEGSIAIYYTTNGTIPTTTSTKYTEMFNVQSGTIIKAIAVFQDGSISSIATKTYSMSATILTYSDVEWIEHSQYITDASNASYGKIYTSSEITDKVATNSIDVRGFTHIKTVVVKRMSSNSAGGLGFMNANNQIISGILYRNESTNGYKVIDMDIPEGTAFIGTTAWTEPNSFGYGDWYMELS